MVKYEVIKSKQVQIRSHSISVQDESRRLQQIKFGEASSKRYIVAKN